MKNRHSSLKTKILAHVYRVDEKLINTDASQLYPHKPTVNWQYKSKMHLILHCGVSVVCPHGPVANWGLWLTTDAQNHASMVLPIAGLGEEDQNSKCQVWFLLIKCISLLHHQKVKISQVKPLSQRLCTSIMVLFLLLFLRIYGFYVMSSLDESYEFIKMCFLHITLNRKNSSLIDIFICCDLFLKFLNHILLTQKLFFLPKTMEHWKFTPNVVLLKNIIYYIKNENFWNRTFNWNFEISENWNKHSNRFKDILNERRCWSCLLVSNLLIWRNWWLYSKSSNPEPVFYCIPWNILYYQGFGSKSFWVKM